MGSGGATLYDVRREECPRPGPARGQSRHHRGEDVGSLREDQRAAGLGGGQAMMGLRRASVRSNSQAEHRPGFSGDVRHEELCLSTHSEISLAPHADAFIFVPAAVHDWATAVLGRTPTLSGEFVTQIGKLVYVFAKRCSLLLRLPEVLSR